MTQLVAQPAAKKRPMFSILKPGETDDDYTTDPTGHYLLATHDLMTAGGKIWNEAQTMEAWRWANTPLGGYRPLPSARKYHRSKARFRHALGGNRSSKSHSLAVEVLWFATGLHPFRLDCKPCTIWYATTTLDKVSDVCWNKLDPLKNGLLLGLDVLKYRFDVVWRSKQLNIPGILRIFWPKRAGISEIHFKAYEQGRESFQGAEVDLVAFDEQYPRDIFEEATSRIGPGKACKFADAFTPLIPDQWLEDRTRWQIPATDEVFHFPLDDQRTDYGGFIEPLLIQQTIDNWPEEVRETRRFGRWGAYTGAIFQSFEKSIHVVSETKEREVFWGNRESGQSRTVPGNDIRPVGVIDWGGSNPFYFLWAARIPHLDNDWFIFDELFWDYRIRGMCRLESLANEIKARTHQRWQTHMFRYWADHDPTNVNEFRHYGISTMPARKVGSIEEISRAGIELMQTHLMPRKYLLSTDFPKGRPTLHIAERCKELIREIPLYRWTESTGDKNAKNVPVKKDDHAVDSVRYLLNGERPQNIHSTGKRIDAKAYRNFNASRSGAFAY